MGSTPALDLGALFPEPSMFDSRDHWRQAGFDVIDREGSREIMVASHWTAPAYMFKKFTNKVRSKDQLKNYRLRVDGAAAIRKLIAKHDLRRVVVPQKWIVELADFSSPHLLIVEKLDLLSRHDTRAAYKDVDEATLRDLCVVVHAFRGLDSGARNLPITRDGRIAFVDTERWKDDTDRASLKHVRTYLTAKQRDLAKKIFKKLKSR